MERVADYIIRKVNEAGAAHIFLIPGRGILYLTDAVAKNKNITPVSTYHEQGASYAAMAYASVHKGVSACLVSTGCAAANAVTACLCAYQDNLPVVFISGNNQLNENTRHTGAGIRTYGSQEADIVSIVKPVTKYAVMLEDAEMTVFEVEKALHLAMDGRRGPVWIDVPLDLQNMKIEESGLVHYESSQKKDPDISCIQAVAEEVNQAKRPVILAGGGSREAEESIRYLSESCRIPVVTSPAGADICGSSRPLSIGTVGSLGGSRAGNFAVQNSDYVLAIGSKLCSQLTGTRKNFARDAKVTAVDIDEKEHQKEGVVHRTVLCDASVFMEKLISCGPARHESSWSDRCLHWKELFSVKNEAFVKELKAADQIDLYSLLDELGPLLPADATLITDAGFEELTVPSVIRFKEGQRCLFPAAQGAMGYAIPAIIGAYAGGRKNLLCIVGDGSIMMNLQELQIIASMKIPVRILVINNNMYAVIRKRQRDLFRRRTIGNDPSDGVPAPDFRGIADCFGLSYKRIGCRKEFLEALPGLTSGIVTGTELIEVMCTPEQKYLHESYAINENRKLVHRPIEDLSPFLPRELIRNEMIVDMAEE